MKQILLTFQTFTSPQLAEPIIAVLKENNIPYELEEDKLYYDPSNLGGSAKAAYHLRIPNSDFEKTEKLLVKSAATTELDEQHYLKSFTDEELMEILLKPDEWSRTDYNLATSLLVIRGKQVNESLLEALRKQRIDDLAKPEENNRIWIITGYVSSILGGLLGIFIGLHMCTAKKTLPNGQRVYMFKKEDRNQGFYIFITGIVCLIFWSIVQLLAVA